MPEYELDPPRQLRFEEPTLITDLAAEMAANLAAELTVDPSDRKPLSELEEQYGLSLTSTAEVIDRLWMQSRIAEELAMPIPCLAMPDFGIPVLWLPSEGELRANWTARHVRELTQRFRDNYDIEDVPPRTALAALKHWLVGFIGANIVASNMDVQAGLLVRVVTKGYELRIHYTKMIAFDPDPVFGNSLSTPVDGYLSPGTYRFGVQGFGDPAPRFDDGVFAIPPTKQANLVIA